MSLLTAKGVYLLLLERQRELERANGLRPARAAISYAHLRAMCANGDGPAEFDTGDGRRQRTFTTAAVEAWLTARTAPGMSTKERAA